MMRWLRRVLWLGVLTGGGVAGYRAWSRKQSVPSAASTEWPPLSPTSNRPEPRQPEPRKPEPRKPEASKSEARTTPATTADTAVEAPRWLPPVNGTNPEGYPVKANDTSRIFHVPGGRFYDRTVAERCYATPEDAIADGYRQAKA